MYRGDGRPILERDDFQTLKGSIKNYLAVWSATKSRSVIPVCALDSRSF